MYVPGHVASFTKILNAIMAKYCVGEMRLMKLPEKLDNGTQEAMTFLKVVLMNGLCFV